MLEIEYKAETEDDITDLLQSLLMVRSISFMSKKFVETRLELKEGGYELQEAFDTIRMLIEPAMTFFCQYNNKYAKPNRKNNA
jgi:hypothetical protein